MALITFKFPFTLNFPFTYQASFWLRVALCLVGVYISIAADAQSGFKVQGMVADSVKGDILELATIQLKSPGAATAEYVQLSGLDGSFLFDRVKAGSYELTISTVGYKTNTTVLAVSHDVDLGKIRMAANTHSLKEAVVTAEKPVITKTSEKTVFNVAQSPTHQTGTAEDALRNMPGVSVDRNGNISMVGKQGVKVLVDGKPSVLAESNLQAFLKSIPANTIESIELITNPSARYDANGNAGIINIKLKKGKRDGLNGSVAVNAGYPDRAGTNVVINYRKNKWNLFGNYSLDYVDIGHEFIDKRDITVRDTVTHYNMYNPSKEKNLNNTLKAGFDFFANDKNTFTYTVSAGHSLSRWASTANAQNLDASTSLLNTFISDALNKSTNVSVTNDLNYLKKYDSTERELMIDLSHTYVYSHSDNQLNSIGYDAAGVEQPAQNLTRNMIPTNKINNVVFQLNYAEPLKRAGHKLETGLKNETTINQNTYNVSDRMNGIYTPNLLLSNGFQYLENIAAFYMIYSGAYKEFLTYSGGIRSEHTFINSNTNNVARNYLSFFPSGTVATALSKTQNLSLSYSRRVRRPSFQQINNTVTYFDQYSTWQGNPYLTPSFSNIVSLSYDIRYKKNMFSFSSENTFTDGEFSESSSIDSNRIARGGIRNGGSSVIIAGSFYAKLEPVKWWSVQMNHLVAWERFGYKQDVNTGPITGSYYNLWMSMDFKFWKNTIFNMNGWYNTGDLFPQGKSKAVGVMNASLKKDFLKDKFSVSLLFQNIANTMKFQWYVNNTNLHTNGSWQNYNRALILTLTYRFGGSQTVKHKDIEENSRLSGGGGKGK